MRHYDTGSKLWSTILGLMLMLLVQWPALFTARMQSPPDEGHMGWNLFACLLGLLAPATWLGFSLRAPGNGIYGWAVVVLSISVWIVVSVSWVR